MKHGWAHHWRDHHMNTICVVVDVNGKWKTGRHAWWVLWLWSGSLWLINTIQTPITRCFPKQHHSSHLCWLFHIWNHHWKKGNGGCEGVKRQPRQCLKSERGCFGKEEEPHSSLLCLFVLLLVILGLVFPLPLLSVGGDSLQMGNTMVVIHHSTMVCVLCFEGQESWHNTQNHFKKGGHSCCGGFSICHSILTLS